MGLFLQLVEIRACGLLVSFRVVINVTGWNQVNAHVSPGLKVHVGIPHTGGALAFHAFNKSYPVMVSASAFWRGQKRGFRVPESTDLSECDVFLDSAGFTAISQWQSKGKQPGMAGIYPWSLAQYLELVCDLSPPRWSAPDLCVEPEVAGDPETIDWRIRATATLLELTLRMVFDWQMQFAKGGSWEAAMNFIHPPVPIIQGWTVSDYQRSLDMTLEVWEQWMPLVAAPVLIGVGSVCRRHLTDPKHGLWAILRGLDGRLPKESRLHLFGVKGPALADLQHMPMVASTDSMAYDFASRVTARERGVSNTMALRAEHMDRWMERQLGGHDRSQRDLFAA